MTYHLYVHQDDQSCSFFLTWGKGQRLSATLPNPIHILTLYQTRKRAYLNFYRQSPPGQSSLPAQQSEPGLRGRVVADGQKASSNVDWHSQLIQAEARLVQELNKWLHHQALYSIRAELVRGQKRHLKIHHSSQPARMDLFLSCSTLDLARLPWETWEIGEDPNCPVSFRNSRSLP